MVFPGTSVWHPTEILPRTHKTPIPIGHSFAGNSCSPSLGETVLTCQRLWSRCPIWKVSLGVHSFVSHKSERTEDVKGHYRKLEQSGNWHRHHCKLSKVRPSDMRVPC